MPPHMVRTARPPPTKRLTRKRDHLSSQDPSHYCMFMHSFILHAFLFPFVPSSYLYQICSTTSTVLRAPFQSGLHSFIASFLVQLFGTRSFKPANINSVFYFYDSFVLLKCGPMDRRLTSSCTAIKLRPILE